MCAYAVVVVAVVVVVVVVVVLVVLIIVVVVVIVAVDVGVRPHIAGYSHTYVRNAIHEHKSADHSQYNTTE